MGNLCCRPKKPGKSPEDIERTIKDAEEDQLIEELRENFNIETFNALFQKQKRTRPDKIMYAMNHRSGAVGMSLLDIFK